MLAQDLMLILKDSYRVIPQTEHELDISNAKAVFDTITTVKPDVVVNCAAHTQVDACEAEHDKAFAVNAHGVKHIARACRKADSLLVHFSTDYVFDGNTQQPYRETDTPHPLSVYGQSKLAGEQYIRDIAPRFIIIRSLWLYGKGGNNFIATIVRLARERTELRVVNDQIGSPTWTKHLSLAVKALLDRTALGIYHVSNQGSCSWYECAVKIVECLRAGIPVVPITSKEINLAAPRPHYSVLDCSKFEHATGIQLPSWDAALYEYITHEYREA